MMNTIKQNKMTNVVFLAHRLDDLTLLDDSSLWTVGSTIRQDSIRPRPQRIGPAHKQSAGLAASVHELERRYNA